MRNCDKRWESYAERYVLKTVSDLYKEFAVENPVAMISESSFTRQKNFLGEEAQDPRVRETCLVKDTKTCNPN